MSKFKVQLKEQDAVEIDGEHFVVQSGCIIFYKGSDVTAAFGLDSFVSAVKVADVK